MSSDSSSSGGSIARPGSPGLSVSSSSLSSVLSFGSNSTATDRYAWSKLWPRLERRGWTVRPSSNPLHDWFWVRPEKNPDEPSHNLGVDYFCSREDVIRYQRNVDQEAEAPLSSRSRSSGIVFIPSVPSLKSRGESSLPSESACCRPSCKRRKLVEPDLTVVVGEGAGKRSFACYKIVLRLASEVFDSMFSHDMKEKQESVIELKNKDPSEWELFYSFVDPETAGLAQINRTNVLVLLPWFHEYAMVHLVCQCDRVIAKLANAGAQSKDLLDYAMLSFHYDLLLTRANIMPIMASRIEKGDLMLDQSLISRLRVLLLREEYESLWIPIKQFLPKSLGIVDPKDFFEMKEELSFLVMKEQKLRVMEEVVKTMPKFVSQLPSISYEGRDRVKNAVAKKLGKELKGVVTLS